MLAALEGFATTSRESLLLHIGASLPGCYVPAFYRFSYAGSGEVMDIAAPAELPLPVAKVIAPAMERAAHSTLLSPEAELGMYMVELGRGCSRGCRFCAAGFIYRPPRLWSAEAILRGLG